MLYVMGMLIGLSGGDAPGADLTSPSSSRLAVWWDAIWQTSDAFFVGVVVDTSRVPDECLMTVSPVRPLRGMMPKGDVVAEVCGAGRNEAYEVGDKDLFRHDKNGRFYGAEGAYRRYPSADWRVRVRHLEVLNHLHAENIDMAERASRLVEMMADEDPLIRAFAVVYAATGRLLMYKLPYPPTKLVEPMIATVDRVDISAQHKAAGFLHAMAQERSGLPVKLRDRARKKSAELVAKRQRRHTP